MLKTMVGRNDLDLLDTDDSKLHDEVCDAIAKAEGSTQ
jgi:hypothetical protein